MTELSFLPELSFVANPVEAVFDSGGRLSELTLVQMDCYVFTLRVVTCRSYLDIQNGEVRR